MNTDEQPDFRKVNNSMNMMTRDVRACVFIEQNCKIPEGVQVGQPIKLMKFQKQFILFEQTKISFLPSKCRRTDNLWSAFP